MYWGLMRNAIESEKRIVKPHAESQRRRELRIAKSEISRRGHKIVNIEVQKVNGGSRVKKEEADMGKCNPYIQK